MKLPKLGSLWMLVAALGFAVMGACVKLASVKFGNTELVFYRSAFGLIVITGSIFAISKPLSFETRKAKPLNFWQLIYTPHIVKHLTRALVGFISLVLFFYAISHLPLATAITLNYTSPLFLAGMLPFFIPQPTNQPNKRTKAWLYFAIFLGFSGVILLLKPTFNGENLLAGLLGLLSGFGAGLAYIQVKQLANLHEPDWRTVFYFTLVSTMLSGFWLLLNASEMPIFADLPLLIGLGISATIGQLALTRAYRTGETLVVASLAYTTVIFASLFGTWFWQESLHWTDVGAIALIILAGIISTKFSTKNSMLTTDTTK